LIFRIVLSFRVFDLGAGSPVPRLTGGEKIRQGRKS
jgi:hypothetical protein